MAIRLLSRVFLFLLIFVSACAPTPTSLFLERRTNPVATLTPFKPRPATIAPGLLVNPAGADQPGSLPTLESLPPTTSPEVAQTVPAANINQPAQEATLIYALVAAFPTIRDGVSFDELKERWTAGWPGLVMTENTRAAMQNVFGIPAGASVRAAPAGEIKAALWQEPGLWGIVPFEELNPELKVLEVDGRSPINADFQAGDYPLKTIIRLQPGDAALPATNRDPARLASVMMTGTTALVRTISYKMQQNGIGYPALMIGDWLRAADILHVSNEVAFTPDCPPPDPYDGSLRFCSAEQNIGLLDEVGVDVIDLSGNHVNDWGTAALLHSLDLYEQRGWQVFAGGRDLASARDPAILERGGMKFAFVGCNVPGPGFAWATADGPGAADCEDFNWLVDEIRQLKASGMLVIATLQHYEYYSPEPRPQQLEDFRRLAEAGADVVSGSQAHFAQALEFHNGSFIHYGLGNLFFDQMSHEYNDGTRTTDIRREFLDRHIFYEGRHISTQLLTTMLEDYSQPRPMTPEERAAFLTEYFTASGWQPAP
ncbi:MAG TPA: CapA family protein, partial [Anaerolineales bacterium]|jgi:poly-gamma-glutamate synthesis protein (capsule biosynthesis protein)